MRLLINRLFPDKVPASVHTGTYRSHDYRDTAEHNQRRGDESPAWLDSVKYKSTQEIESAIARLENEVTNRREGDEQRRKAYIDILKQNLIKQGKRLELAFHEVIDTLKEIDKLGGEATIGVDLTSSVIKSVRSSTVKGLTTFDLRAPSAERNLSVHDEQPDYHIRTQSTFHRGVLVPGCPGSYKTNS